MMRNATGVVAVAFIVAGIVLATARGADAQCGDANRTGSVTVSDGVLVLRAAAQLPANCPQERCDMNLDDQVTVTDGVLALRVAAGVPGTKTACSSVQAGAMFGALQKNMSFGNVASPAGRALGAGTSSACPDGGSQIDDGVTVTFFDCQDGDFVTNGSISFTELDVDVVEVTYDTVDFVISTGEVFATAGFLDFSFFDETQVDGELQYSSSVFGDYVSTYSEVLLDGDFVAFSGQVTTDITAGADAFANVSEVLTVIFSETLARIAVTYVNGDFDIFTLADGLCEPCSSGCGNPNLTCLSCIDDCSNSSARCGIDFDFLDCGDGFFGPVGLCEVCTGDFDCNGSDGLSCFACDRDCTGGVMRCGSSQAFVECEDGTF